MPKAVHRRWSAAVLACSLAIVSLAACQPSETAKPGAAGMGATAASRGAVVVASFNFTESELLGAIYALALQNAGVPVRWELDLGPRELVLPALEQGLVDVVPEYLGTALMSLEPSTSVTMSDGEAVRAELTRAFARWHVRVLQPAQAQDQNGLAVTRATADRLHLRTVSDLGPVARGLVLGGPPECPSRPFCLLGLQSAYGLHFARFVPFDTERQRVEAIEQGVVNVAVIFSTDGYLAAGGLVWLADDRRLQPAENVVPVVTTWAAERYGKRLTDALDAVSARLTSNNLIFLNWRVDVAGKDVIAEARAWLERHGLLRPEPQKARQPGRQ
ncbi:MAG: glycine betaine ABC transporter substrate-binding protein [Micromonosporaceae bacterium]